MAKHPNLEALLTLIDEQIDLSDYGENTYDLNELYYNLYLLVRGE